MSTNNPALSRSPLVTVDVVLLTLKDGGLQVALVQRDKEPYAGQWALPGGWIHADEDKDSLDAATRILKEKAGLVSPYLEQLASFASGTRDPRGWSVSLCYYAVVPESLIDAAENHPVKWVPVTSVRTLPFDHLQILQTAEQRVRSKTIYSSLPLYLMPEQFTLTQVQSVYEQVLGAELDKRGFRRWLEELNVLKPLEVRAEARGRPAQYYTLKRRANHLSIANKTLDVKG